MKTVIFTPLQPLIFKSDFEVFYQLLGSLTLSTLHIDEVMIHVLKILIQLIIFFCHTNLLPYLLCFLHEIILTLWRRWFNISSIICFLLHQKVPFSLQSLLKILVLWDIWICIQLLIFHPLLFQMFMVFWGINLLCSPQSFTWAPLI